VIYTLDILNQAVRFRFGVGFWSFLARLDRSRAGL